MKASTNWLRELVGMPELSSQEMARLLTKGGLEVEGITPFGRSLEGVVIAEVHGRRAHPNRDRVTLVTVFDGEREHEVVCGANNVPDPTARPRPRVLFARVGATLPNGLTIAPREVGGVVSHGMLCSEAELAIGPDADGIVVLDAPDPGRAGEPAAVALGLTDDVLDMSITANRPDALGHVGLARELAAHLGRPFGPRIGVVPSRMLSHAPSVAPPARAVHLIDDAQPIDTINMLEASSGTPLALPIRIEAPNRCARYLGLVVQRVGRTRSPLWLRHRLHVLGLRAIDPIVDATNWALMLFGNPVHAFDLDKLAGGIVVRLSRAGERFVALDGSEHALTEDDLVIADEERPVALAGVMGGKDSAVTAATQHVLLEVAYFEPRSVRRTARRHGFHTDSSHRFERGVDKSALELAMRALASLVSNVSRGAPSPTIVDATADAAALKPTRIDLPISLSGEVIGQPIEAKEIQSLLELLGCFLSPGGTGQLTVTAPGHRPDLLRPIDLVEEVARMRGYDRLEEKLMRVGGDARHRTRPPVIRRIRQAATGAGLFEALTHSLLAPRELDKARAPVGEVALANPISDERAVLRTSLLPGLLASVGRSERRGDRRVRLFELGRVYGVAPLQTKGAIAPVPFREPLMLGAVLAGPRDGWLGAAAAVDFWDGKGALEAFFGGLGLGDAARFEAHPEPPPFLHPARAAQVLLSGSAIGELGELHPDVADAFELLAPPIVWMLDAEALIAVCEAAGPRAALALPRFPAVERDLAIVVDDAVIAGDVIRVLAAVDVTLIERVALFDLYRGKPVPEGKKSLAFRIAYRDPEATLTDAKVDAVHAAALAKAESTFGAALRG